MSIDLNNFPVSDHTVTAQFDMYPVGNTGFYWKHKEQELDFTGNIEEFNLYLLDKIESGDIIVPPKPEEPVEESVEEIQPAVTEENTNAEIAESN